MVYSIRELAELAGVSTRTLRYYNEIGLLTPLYVNETGCRYYGEQEVALLQQILFYRERGFDLKSIKSIIYEEDFDLLNAMQEHLKQLEEQQKHTAALIQTVKQTILSMKGKCNMSDQEKFKVFKEKIVQDNEVQYGEEIREKYGEEQVSAANQKILNMSSKKWEKFKGLEVEIKEQLKAGVLLGIEPTSKEARQIFLLHKEWLGMTWKNYTKEAHKGVASMYIYDERFKAYYDSEIQGCAELLKETIWYWVDQV